MTKIALCYSGRPRHYRECLQNHKDFFGLGNEDVDVFAHLWFDEDLVGIPFRSDAPHQGSWPGIELQKWVEENWKPKKVIYEKQKDEYFRQLYSDVWNISHEKLNPIPRLHPKDHQLSMFYGIKKSIEMKNEYEVENNFKYDYVFRMRTDFVMVANLGNIENYDKEKLHISSYDSTALINQYLPGTWVQDLGIADRYIVDIFAFGGSDCMDKYAKVYDNIPYMVQSEYPMHSSDVLIGYNTFIIENMPVKRHASRAYKIYPNTEVYYEGSHHHHLGGYGIPNWNGKCYNDY